MLTSIPFGITTWLVGLTTFLLAWKTIRRPKGIPPGPLWNIPFLGYVPFIKGTILDTFAELRKKYGDIFHVYLGPQLIIVLNGYDVIKEALVQHGDIFSDRPSFHGFEEFGVRKGIITSSGKIWKEQRKFALETLREFGFGKNILQGKIREEITFFLTAMEEEKGKVFDIKHLVQTAVSNVTCNIIFGKRFQYNDQEFVSNLKIMDELVGSGAEGLVQGSFLRYLPGDITGYKANVRKMMVIRRFIEASVQDHEANFQPDSINDFIDAYIKEMKDKELRGIETAITAEHLWRTILDLFTAGTETTATTIRWALVFILHHPEIQERLYQELQDKVGSGRLPVLEDRQQLPFFNAFINEVQRVGDIAPLAVVHAASQDFPLRGHRIPKDTFIFVNLDSVLKDPAVYKDPTAFQPDRFLKDGKVVKPDEFLPFGTGRRVCLGESLAKMELFLFLTAMVQRFRFEQVENQPLPELVGIIGNTHSPKPFQMRAVLRT